MNPIKQFEAEVRENIRKLRADSDLQASSRMWLRSVAPCQYAYNFRWMGRPIIQLPQDMVAMQEIIWEVKPDLVIECGIAHGGALVYYASILELMGHGSVLGIDIDIRAHNREAIEQHPMFKRIEMIEGSSIAPEIISKVHDIAKGKKVVVVLDSNHTHDHVMGELEAYAPLVGKGSYCVVMDTTVEDMPEGSFPDRPWDKGNNPKTAVWEYLKKDDRFEIDRDIESKLLITVCADGYLKCVKD